MKPKELLHPLETG